MRTIADLTSDNYDSQYLCVDCHHPLYSQLRTRREVCLNLDCSKWPSDFSSVANAQSIKGSPAYDELDEKLSQLRERVQRCNLAYLRRFLLNERKKLSLSLLFGSGMRIRDWHGISELLILTQQQPSRRLHLLGDKNEIIFRSILLDITRWAEQMRFMEDLRTGRYAVLRRTSGNFEDDAFELKYLSAVRQDEKGFGLVNFNKVDEATSEYEEIEALATPSPSPLTTDFADNLDTLWPLTLRLRYLLRSHWRTSQQYDYAPNLVDLVILVSYWAQSAGNQTCRIPVGKEGDEVQKLDIYLQRNSDGAVSAKEFINRYIDCQEQVPVIIRTPDGWLFDRATLFLFVMYLQGEPNLRTKSSSHSRDPLLAKMRRRAGSEFEIWLRGQLRDKDYLGPEAPVKVRYEYDILMISESQRTIVLADAQYRDLNSSSVTGENLLSQELLDQDALLDQAIQQEYRRLYFTENLSLFKKMLAPKRPWDSYQVKSCLVTKTTPLIARYKGTEVLKAREFLESIASD